MNSFWAGILVLILFSTSVEAIPFSRRNLLKWVGFGAAAPVVAPLVSQDLVSGASKVPASFLITDPVQRQLRASHLRRFFHSTTLRHHLSFGGTIQGGHALHSLDVGIYLSETGHPDFASMKSAINKAREAVASQLASPDWELWFDSSLERWRPVAYSDVVGSELLEKLTNPFMSPNLASGPSMDDWIGSQLVSIEEELARELQVPLVDVQKAVQFLLEPDELLEGALRGDFASKANTVYDELFYTQYIKKLALVSPTRAFYLRRKYESHRAYLKHLEVSGEHWARKEFESSLERQLGFLLKRDAAGSFLEPVSVELNYPSFTNYFEKPSARLLEEMVRGYVLTIARLEAALENVSFLRPSGFRESLSQALSQSLGESRRSLKNLPRYLQTISADPFLRRQFLISPEGGTETVQSTTFVEISPLEWAQMVLRISNSLGLASSLIERMGLGVESGSDTVVGADTSEACERVLSEQAGGLTQIPFIPSPVLNGHDTATSADAILVKPLRQE